MVPAILILTFAWTLKTMTESLGAKEFVAGLVGGVSGPLLGLFPAIIFLVGAFLAFATGTSWGTFGILIPIVVNIFSGTNHTMNDHLNLSVHGRCSMPETTAHRYPIPPSWHLPEPSATI